MEPGRSPLIQGAALTNGFAPPPWTDPPTAVSCTSTDEHLLACLIHGDLHALEVLHTRYARLVFTLAVRVLADESDAEEVTQDVFEQVWRVAASFDPARGSVGRWLIAIAYHVAMNALRPRYRRPRLCQLEATARHIERIPDLALDVAGRVVDQLEAAQLHRAVRSLPAPQQHAVALAYLVGLSHAEVAAALDVPLGTVKANIRRGLTRLRTTVAGLGLGLDGDDREAWA